MPIFAFAFPSVWCGVTSVNETLIKMWILLGPTHRFSLGNYSFKLEKPLKLGRWVRYGWSWVGGWGDGSVTSVLVLQAQGPEVESSTPVNSWAQQHVSAIPVLGGRDYLAKWWARLRNFISENKVGALKVASSHWGHCTHGVYRHTNRQNTAPPHT